MAFASNSCINPLLDSGPVCDKGQILPQAMNSQLPSTSIEHSGCMYVSYVLKYEDNWNFRSICILPSNFGTIVFESYQHGL